VNVQRFFAELKRRNVYKVAVAYAVVAWLLIQLASILFPTFEAPAWVMKVFIAVVALGFPLALIFAWAFELTPEGIKRTEDVAPNGSIARRTGHKLATGIALLTVIAAGLLAYQLFRRSTRAPTQPSSATSSIIVDKSIAVLPFDSLSEDKANAYFAVGVQDEILTRLAKVRDLKVISRTSTQQYQSKPGNVAEIAKQLGVAHLLEGSVQKSGDAVRVNVQLIKAEGDSHLWAETYDGKLTDMFAFQTDVARRIASSLEAKLTGREKEAINYIGTKVPAAYDAFLRGLALRNSQSRQEQNQLIEYCRQAVALDPDYAAAWSEIAAAEGLKYAQGDRTEKQRATVKEAADNALRLDPSGRDGHAAMGLYLYYCLQEFDAALRELEQARQAAPNDASVIQAIGLVKRRQGKLDEAIDLQMQAAQLDPRSEDIWVNIAWTYHGMRRFSEARTMFDRALAITPNDRSILARRAGTLLAEGDLQGAARIYAEIVPRSGSDGYGGAIAVLIFQRRYDEAIAKITADLQEPPIEGTRPTAVANAYLTLGELYQATGRSAEAQQTFTQVEAELQRLAAAGNDSPDVRATMLLVHAFQGRREEVERAAAAHIAAQEKDRWTGPLAEEDAARAFCIVGDYDRALSLLERLMARSYADCVTPALLRLDPVWDPVRDDPRFQKLAAGKP
jgi:TolB-like protein/Tfp pilus assembly protein PilF